MRWKATDPTSRRLRGLVLVVIFAVALPSFLLSGFGLIAINNERDAALQRVRDTYQPMATTLAQRLTQRLHEIAQGSAPPLMQLASWGHREIAGLDKDFYQWFESIDFATNYFVCDESGAPLIPRPGLPAPSWFGYAPAEYTKGQLNEFQKGDAQAAIAQYQLLLARLGADDPFRCVLLNALSRALAKNNQFDESMRSALELVETCPMFIDSAGYHLALGAQLRSLEVLIGKNQDPFSRATTLARLLADPMLPASPDQQGFVARRARWLLQGLADAHQSPAVAKIAAAAERDQILAVCSRNASNNVNGTQLLTLSQANQPHLLVAHQANGISGFEIVPGALAGLLQQLSQPLFPDENIRAQMSPLMDALPPETSKGILAASVPLSGDLSSWRLELWLSGSQALDELAHSRTQIYFWILLLLVLALSGGIGWLVRVMLREARLAHMKTDFVSSVSHELRTPLTSIRMFTETLLLKRVKNPAEEQECLQIIGQETERLSRLVERILDFSRMEAGRKAYRFQLVPVGHLIQAAVDACRFAIVEQGFHVDVSIEPDLPEIPVDPDALVEALINLLSNAFKYSHQSRGVEIRACREQAGVSIHVTDHGIGIPKSEQLKIFEKFYRVDSPLAVEVSGSGLGLSLVHYIVLAHGGTVHVDSAPGKGSTFSLWLPLVREERA